MRRLMFLTMFIAMPFLNSCSVMYGGRAIFSVPDYTSTTWLQYEGVDDPCVKNPAVALKDLGGGVPATLWRRTGVFYLHPSGNVISAYYTYPVAGNLRNSWRGNSDGRPIAINGPDWKIEVPNAGCNSNITLTITVIYMGRVEPWVGEYDLYNANLREPCGNRY